MKRQAWGAYGRGLLLFFLAYLFSARLGLSLVAFAKGNVTLVWPPSGLSLAVLLLYGVRYWPALSAGAFVATAMTGAPVEVAAGVAVGNTLEGVLGAWLMLRSGEFHPRLDSLGSIFWLILASVGGTLVSAGLGVTSLCLGGVLTLERTLSVGVVWWVGDMLSVLVLTPVLLTGYASRGLSARPRLWLEAGALGLYMVAACLLVFTDPLGLGRGLYSLAFVIFPGLIWAALRFKQRGATAATALVATMAIGSLLVELSPQQQRLPEQLLLLQVFLGVAAVTGLVLGAAVEVRQRAEAGRMALVAELREAVRARDEFLSMASHELKTPLTALALQVEGLLRHLRSGKLAAMAPEQLERLAARPREQVHRLAQLVEALLDVSRIATGRMTLEQTYMDLGALAREVVERYREELERVHGRVELQLEEGVVGQWDRLRLEQVLTNLLTNAMKFGPGRPVEVAVGRQGEVAWLRVVDHGIGVHAEDQSRIFERFERAVSSRAFGGMGLGLYVSREIAQAHGGRIWLESSPGQGACFTVELPLESSASPRPMLQVS